MYLLVIVTVQEFLQTTYLILDNSLFSINYGVLNLFIFLNPNSPSKPLPQIYKFP